MARTEHAEDDPDEALGLATLGGNRLAELTRAECKLGDGELDDEDKWLLEEDTEHWLALSSPEQRAWLDDI